MKLTSIQRAVSTVLVTASVVLVGVASVAAAAGSGPRLERMCLGDTIDEACQVGPPSGTTDGHGSTDSGNADLAAANMAAAAYQDVERAEAAGYASTLDSIGCFEDPQLGGMGLHYANEELMDANLEATAPEALLYELDHRGDIAALVAHEYIVPIDLWTSSAPPRLFGREFHQHPVLPVWILHTWIWKDNPAGVFADFNPRVRPCPDGVPVFGEDASPSGFASAPSSGATAPDDAALELLAPDEPWDGVARSDLDAEWWQRALAMPEDISPYTDTTGERCGYQQSGSVFMLPGNFVGGILERTCVVAEGTAIYVFMAGGGCSTVEPPPYFGRTEDELRACASASFDEDIAEYQARIDGVDVGDLDTYRATSPMFTITLAEDNVFGIEPGVGQMVTDAISFIIAPPPPGEYVIEVSATLAGNPEPGGSIITLIVESPRIVEPPT